MSQDHIRYDILAQEALRGVIKKVLMETATTGHLPGEHHFFITFLTNAPGVRISSALHERYPDQMTIVVQHQFWGLKVSDTQFEIGLSFSDQPEKLVIPFSAVRGFYDPSVNFELEFDTLISEDDENDNEESPDITTLALDSTIQKSPEVDASETIAPADKKASDHNDDSGDNGNNAESGGSKDNSADVVSLDSFRKKN